MIKLASIPDPEPFIEVKEMDYFEAYEILNSLKIPPTHQNIQILRKFNTQYKPCIKYEKFTNFILELSLLGKAATIYIFIRKLKQTLEEAQAKAVLAIPDAKEFIYDSNSV
jgi:hypothetical protein